MDNNWNKIEWFFKQKIKGGDTNEKENNWLERCAGMDCINAFICSYSIGRYSIKNFTILRRRELCFLVLEKKILNWKKK